MSLTFREGAAWFQIFFGLTYFVWGLVGKDWVTRYFAPFGLWQILFAAMYFLNGRVADEILIPVFVVSFVAVGVWLIRVHRAFRAHTRDVLRQRAAAAHGGHAAGGTAS